MAPERAGFELPLLLAAAFRAVIDDLHLELATLGHPDLRPVHGFALQAIGPDGATISQLGRRLGVTKQAAAKTAAGLETLGYLTRGAEPGDGRATRLMRNPRGDEVIALSAEIFDQLRGRWSDQLGLARVDELEDALAAIAGDRRAGLGDLPGWLG